MYGRTVVEYVKTGESGQVQIIVVPGKVKIACYLKAAVSIQTLPSKTGAVLLNRV